MSLEDKPKSPLEVAQEKGHIEIGGTKRKVVTGARKTKERQLEREKEIEKQRKNMAIFKATLRKAADKADGQDSDEWEDVEEDFPMVKLEELMENLKIDDGEDF